MNRKTRILYVEDEAIWRREITKILSEANCLVKTAENTDIARSLLTNSFFHIVLLDISMESGNKKNTDGIEFLREINNWQREGAFETAMLTAYWSRSREEKTLDKYGVFCFLDKRNFDEKKFLTKIRQGIEIAKINLMLRISNFEEAQSQMNNMQVGGNRLKSSDPLFERLREELEDLFCRLFSHVVEIGLRPMETGFSGTRVLIADLYFEDRLPGSSVVIKFGDYKIMKREYENFKDYVEYRVSGAKHTAIGKFRRTSNLGGILYSFLGAGMEKVRSFYQFFEVASLSDVQFTLHRLFKITCRPWYVNFKSSGLCDLMDYYWTSLARPFEGIRRTKASLKSVKGKGRLIFRSLGSSQQFLDPVAQIENLKVFGDLIECITHGDLNLGNLLVDEHGDSWLIDFQSTGFSHYFRDFVELDTCIRILDLDHKLFSLQERLAMEAVLNSISNFEELGNLKVGFSSKNDLVSKSFSTVLYLREMAGNIKLLNDDNMASYYVGLFCNTLNFIRFPGYTKIQKEHALLSASLILDRLKAMKAI